MSCNDCKDCDVDEKIMKCKTEISQQIEDYNSKLCSIEKDISELVSIFRASKGFIRISGSIGRGVRWAALTTAAIGALWLALKATAYAIMAAFR